MPEFTVSGNEVERTYNGHQNWKMPTLATTEPDAWHTSHAQLPYNEHSMDWLELKLWETMVTFFERRRKQEQRLAKWLPRVLGALVVSIPFLWLIGLGMAR